MRIKTGDVQDFYNTPDESVNAPEAGFVGQFIYGKISLDSNVINYNLWNKNSHHRDGMGVCSVSFSLSPEKMVI